MVGIAEAIFALYPNQGIERRVIVISIDGVESIKSWDDALGPQPTQAELDAVTQEQVDTARLAKLRLQAKTLIDSTNDDSVERDKAIAFAVLDGVNSLRAWLVDFKATVAATTSLETLKTGVAALPDLREITRQQMLDVIKTKLD